MNRGGEHRRIFRAGADFQKFLDLLGEVSEVFHLEVHAYCLMDNHYHLLVRTPEAGLGRAMRHLNGVYTQYFNRRTGRDGPLFRGRYMAKLVGSDSYQLQASRYIHLNPVDAGIVDLPEHYDYSSYRAYLDSRWAPDWLHTTTLLDYFLPGDARRQYQQFVEQGVDPETRNFYEADRVEPAFGDDEFKAAIQTRVEGRLSRPNPEIPDSRRLQMRPGLASIARVVAVAFATDGTTLRPVTGRRGHRKSLARPAALYLARHEAGASLAAAAAWQGYRSYNSAATALTRFRRRMSDPELLAKLRLARSLLYKVET
jgi:REP element-mobilizing transposase RayT